MKSMKRIAAYLLTAALVCSMSTTAFAADASTPETQDMTVTAKATTTTEPTYTITIPATVDLGTITKTAESSVKTQQFEVTASNMNSFPDNKQINISISSDFLLKSGENTCLLYTSVSGPHGTGTQSDSAPYG